MRSFFSTLWIAMSLALAAGLPLACGDDPDDCQEGCTGGAGGDVAECASNLDCDPGFACIEGACGNCASDGHCFREERCDPASLLCVFREGWGNECGEHQDCPVGRFCAQGLCLANDFVTPCGGRGQCPEGMRCNRRVGAPPVCEEDLGCAVDEDCSEGEICNPGTARCELGCTPENQADVCSTRQSCIEGRCLECLSDEDCAAGLSCNVLAGLCTGQESCFTDRDCEAGLVCNRRIAICTEPPPACSSDNDCLQDERCDVQTGRCHLRACVPDQDAPNGTQEEAVPLSNGERKNLVVCEGEEKWYRLSLLEGDRISVVIEADFLTTDGFDAQLRTADGQILQSSVHELKTIVSHAGDYFVRIRTRSGRVHYGLRVLVSKGTPCRNDDLEPNDEPTQAAPREPGSHPGLVICPADVDWYVIPVPVGRGLEVTMAQDGSGNLELELYDSNGATLLDADDGIELEKNVSAPRLQGDRAYVRVRASNQRTESVYGLEITLR